MKIETQKGRRDDNSAYIRILGNKEIGHLVSKIQSAVISSGNELERILLSKCNIIDNIDIFISETENNITKDNVYVCPKKNFKKTQRFKDIINLKIEPDLLIFIVENKRLCKIVELKDGDSFDTKKSRGEYEHLEMFTEKFGRQIPFTSEFYICCFNQNDKQKIKEGFKNYFDLPHILTGKELCEILKLNYEEIVNIREKDAESNFEYFLDELLKIEKVKNYILKNINP